MREFLRGLFRPNKNTEVEDGKQVLDRHLKDMGIKDQDQFDNQPAIERRGGKKEKDQKKKP